jgi:hypothetical protein
LRAAVRERQTLSFVYALITVFVYSIGARLLIDAAKETPERHKTVSTEQHTEIPLPQGKEPLRFGSTRANFARGSVRSAARGNMVSTLRGKATNIASRRSRAIDTRLKKDVLQCGATVFKWVLCDFCPCSSFIADAIIRLLSGLYI